MDPGIDYRVPTRHKIMVSPRLAVGVHGLMVQETSSLVAGGNQPLSLEVENFGSMAIMFKRGSDCGRRLRGLCGFPNVKLKMYQVASEFETE